MSKSKELTYDLIQTEAEIFAASYRNKHDVPSLPTEKDLKKYKEMLFSEFPVLVKSVKKYLENQNVWLAHDYEHLVEVASLAGYIADYECKFRKLKGERKVRIIRTSILAGLLHDIERHLGFGEEHMIKGEETANKLLVQVGIDNKKVSKVVRQHDNTNFKAEDDLELEISYGSVFDADHFRYGLEREDTFWRMKEALGKSTEEVIHDYKFLPPIRNAWKTRYGKNIGPELIDFGLAIAKHIEEKFS